MLSRSLADTRFEQSERHETVPVTRRLDVGDEGMTVELARHPWMVATRDWCGDAGLPRSRLPGDPVVLMLLGGIDRERCGDDAHVAEGLREVAQLLPAPGVDLLGQ